MPSIESRVNGIRTKIFHSFKFRLNSIDSKVRRWHVASRYYIDIVTLCQLFVHIIAFCRSKAVQAAVKITWLG